MIKYKISDRRNELNEFYVLELISNDIVFAGNHKDCVYLATRLNESNDSFDTVFNEMKNDKRKRGNLY